MPKSAFALKIGNVLLCEDVRAELYGKHSLFGVYAGDIVVGEIAGFLRMALYAEIFGNALGTSSIEVTVAYADKPVAVISVEFDFRDLRDPALIVLPSFPVALDKLGKITVDAESQGVNKRLLAKAVRLGDVRSIPPPTAPLRP